MRLLESVPLGTADAWDPDGVYDAFAAWAEARGTAFYPHQDEALIALLGGSNVVLATPTGHLHFAGRPLVTRVA